MTIKNTLDKVFGPVGTSSGIFLIVAGLIITYFSFTGLILVLTGAFVGLTSTCTFIDFDKGRLKFSFNLFGIVPTGRWVRIQSDMKIGIKKSNKVWRSYSRSNRILEIAGNDYRLILYDGKGREIMPVQKFDTIDSAKATLEKFSKQTGIGVI